MSVVTTSTLETWYMPGSLGINTTAPRAQLSVVAPGSLEIGGSEASATFLTSSGVLGSTAGDELRLGSFGFHSGSGNATSLGIRARRVQTGSDWTTTAIGLRIDVDNTPQVNNSGLWLNARGGVVVNGVTIGGDVPGLDYPFEYESIGVGHPGMNLRLQSPNSVIMHAGGAERVTVSRTGLAVSGELSWSGSKLTSAGSIELAGGTPYIDFHFANLPQDFNARLINDANGQLTVEASRLRVKGTLAVEGPLVVQGAMDDNAARAMLSGLPPYSVIVAVESRNQGTALVWYWKDGNGTRRKAWDQGATF